MGRKRHSYICIHVHMMVYIGFLFFLRISKYVRKMRLIGNHHSSEYGAFFLYHLEFAISRPASSYLGRNYICMTVAFTD